jgi:hypothetical protein
MTSLIKLRERKILRNVLFLRLFTPLRLSVVLIFGMWSLVAFTSAMQAAAESEERLWSTGEPLIKRLQPEKENGLGYQLVYLVRAPIEIVWKFKTDFANPFLISNKYITAHKLILHKGHTAVTEDEYTYAPEARFKWRTILRPAAYRLDFVLLNPEECRQRYHYGHIRLEAFGQATKITHVAYFDFFGARLWSAYPFPGGMYSFLRYTARWEQTVISNLKTDYQRKAGNPGR